ncbi:uncharacterized protein LOC113168519 [Anabas testudineus]|uniref:Ig-like domain-containing protein n=1 Tax=Anabas testudineus TaxID=64144 RepID=A0AAQ6IFH7_ANATE|nr:uncharacterized protein LOC113168519 [Anabas testudineus]
MSSLCLVLFLLFEPAAATLVISPNRAQFFRYEQITLSCDESEGSVMRSTVSQTSQPCEGGFGDQTKTSCILKNVYPSDSGVYWCESKWVMSNKVNITVTAGNVILESSARPVTEGSEVTLKCSYRKRYESESTSEFEAVFFKNDAFVGKATGELTRNAQEGFYKCEHPTEGESPKSWLSVTDPPNLEKVVKTPPPPSAAAAAAPPPMSLTMLMCIILVFILYTAIIIVSVCAYQRWTRVKAERIYEHLTMQM